MALMRPSPILLALAAVTLALAGCKKPPPKTTEAQQARAVRVVQVSMQPISGALAASGDLTPREEAAVFPEVAGYRVSRVLVDMGDTVKKGQTLVQLDPTMIQAGLAQQQALAAQAEANACCWASPAWIRVGSSATRVWPFFTVSPTSTSTRATR